MHEFVRLFFNDADYFVGTLFIGGIIGIALLGVVIMFIMDMKK